MKINLIVIFYIISSIASAQVAEIKSFDTLWNEYYQKSFAKKAAEFEKESNDLSLSRAKRHWLPRAYVGAQWFSTNDPTQVFFTNLGQRSIEQTDFVPNDLNNPERKNFKTASLGLDLPLYEGGMKSSQTSIYESLVKASDLEIKAKKTEEYAELSRHYGGVLIFEKNSRYLSELKNNLEKIISSYQVGSQVNPVGYSGLLGLKGVKNRIEGFLYELDLKIINAKTVINTKRENGTIWSTDQSETLNTFLSKNLSLTSTSPSSSMLLAQELKVNTLTNIKDMEKSRHLPRIGVFAQNNIYSGSRDTANAQSYGLYLMWDLFNSDSYGRVGEANAKALAGQAKLQAGKQEEKIMLDQMLSSKSTLEKSIELLENSDSLLKEQSINAMKLFKSGMLSALQLAEVINRRVDLIESKNKADVQYLEVYTRIYQLNN
jgi:outer membrane protein TolC